LLHKPEITPLPFPTTSATAPAPSSRGFFAFSGDRDRDRVIAVTMLDSCEQAMCAHAQVA
jgi:hypothetical protein